MSEDLKDQLNRLVADPPPPTGVPSEAVFNRVRTVRRRRAAGAAGAVAAATVAVIAVAAGTLSGPNTAPPVTETPGLPKTIVTGPPTTTPSTARTSAPPSSTTTGTTTNTAPPGRNSDTPETKDTPPTRKPSSPSSKTTTPPLVAPPVNLNVELQRTINAFNVTVQVTESGTVLAPTFEEGGTMTGPFAKHLLYVKFWWGDGTVEEWDRYGGISCYGAKKPVTGTSTTQLGTHTYKSPGVYKFTYQVTYCTPGSDSGRKVTKTTTMTVPEGDNP